MSFLKQSTSVTIRLGPFLDKTDGVTEETALSPVVEVSKNHGAFAARSSATAISHDAAGWYAIPLDTTDTGTLGNFIVKSDDSANHLPVWREFTVIPANVYDSIVSGTDLLQVDTTEWAGAATNSADSALLSGNEVADAVLKRDMSAITGEASRSPLNALRLLRNKWSVSAGTMTVTKEDDTTSAWTSAVVGTPGADPITSSDPA